jgi:antitoxin component YwqK of YwqJK toxin-antitoxin module
VQKTILNNFFKISVLLFQLTCFGQSDTVPNLKKKGKWIFFGRERPDSLPPVKLIQHADGPHISYRSDSTKTCEGFYKDNRKNGVWRYYYEDGISLREIKTLMNNSLDGIYKKYYRNGQLKEESTYSKGKRIGKCVIYYENGQLEYQAVYNDAHKEDGKVIYYFKNGQTEFIYEAKNGTPYGKATRFYKNGEVHETIHYDDNGRVISK